LPGVALEYEKDVRVPVSSDIDLVTARREGRLMADQLGFSASEATLVATAISELARNIVNYARNGEIHVSLVNNGVKRGIIVVARDQGPGIADIKLAMQAGYSTSGGLGLGLPGVRRIMDEFDIASEPGRGTTITVTKWKRR
jgi:serine/threonine-protein kinase RsbT